MPDKASVYRWFRTHQEFCDNYARAKEDSADALAEEILDIADEGENDWMETHAKDNVGWQLNGEHVQRSRLRVDARKWVAAKLKPKKYGDKTIIEGGDTDKPIQLNINANVGNQLNGLAKPSLLAPGEVQSLTVRTPSGQDVSGSDNGTESSDRKAGQ